MHNFTNYKYLYYNKNRCIMKIINLNESQFTRLFEGDGDSIFLDGNDTTSRFGSEVSNQAVITRQDGDEEMSKPIDTNKFSKQQTTQQWGNTNRRAFNTI